MSFLCSAFSTVSSTLSFLVLKFSLLFAMRSWNFKAGSYTSSSVSSSMSFLWAKENLLIPLAGKRRVEVTFGALFRNPGVILDRKERFKALLSADESSLEAVAGAVFFVLAVSALILSAS